MSLYIIKQSCAFCNPSTGEWYRLCNHDIATPPEWVVKQPLFAALCRSGLIDRGERPAAEPPAPAERKPGKSK